MKEVYIAQVITDGVANKIIGKRQADSYDKVVKMANTNLAKCTDYLNRFKEVSIVVKKYQWIETWNIPVKG
jgi:hypothetical protein